MFQLAEIVRRRRQSRQHTPALRLALGFSVGLTLLFSAGLFSIGLLYAQITARLPALEEVAILVEAPGGLLRQPTRLYERNNQQVIAVLQHPAAAESVYLRLNDPAMPLPAWLIQAALAARQPDFWQSPGYSLSDLSAESHPTLAQQLVYELLLADETPGLRRALRERFLAGQLIETYGHERVLEWYLNSSQYGPLIYGLDAAARAYFGKPATEVTPAEAALLAALNETPTINPAALPAGVWLRQQEILARMFQSGWLEAEELYQAGQQRPLLRPPASPFDLAPTFSALALAQAAEQVGLRTLQRGGYRIVTTLDLNLQNQSACSAAVQLQRLTNNTVLSSEAQQSCQAARLLPTLNLPPAEDNQLLSASVVILDNANGQILALVGAGLPSNDPALYPVRPGGSILSPVVYLTAFSRGFSPGSMVWDIPGNDAAEQPFQSYYGPLRLRTALANEYPGPLQQLLSQLGLQNVQTTAHQLGLDSFTLPAASANQPLYSAFQQTPVSLLEISQALATLGNQGLAAGQLTAAYPGDQGLNASALLRLQDPSGRNILDWSRPQNRAVVSPQLAFLLNHVLSDEIARWPSQGHPNSLEVGRPAAVLTGRTLAEQDGWTVGYTPYVTVGVWFGALDGSRYPALPKAASALLHALLQTAAQEQPLTGWSAPPGVSMVTVCDPSGLLPSRNCPKRVSEVFINGTEPTAPDNLYRTFQLNRETGRLATVFTPINLLEEKVYLAAPPQAQAWAQQAGIELPPNTYDAIFALPASSSNALIQTPELFAHVSGVVKITGTAAGPDFSYYRLQVGAGLNPRQWLQIGSDVNSPVENGLLAEWDTHGLSGLYALQLLVVRENQVVLQSLGQVTIDNQAPQVKLLSPQPGETLTPIRNRAVIFHAQASDNLEVARLEFYLNDTLLATVSQPPYLLAWSPQNGSHRLQIRAFDLAGNTSQVEVRFRVQP